MISFFKYVFPAFLALLGVVLGVYLTSSFNDTSLRSKLKYEWKTKIVDKRLEIVERTTVIFNKLPEAQIIFDEYTIKILDSNKLNTKEHFEFRDRMIGMKNELFNVLLLSQLYFGDSTKNVIKNITLQNENKEWSKLDPEAYSKLIGAMTYEINYFPDDQEVKILPKNENSMNDIDKIIWTALATLIGGIIIYVGGRIIEKIFIDPIQEYKKALANIHESLIFYANIYYNSSIHSKEDNIEASKSIRKLASELSAKTNQVPWKNFFSLLKVTRSYENSMNAVSELIGLSNSLFHSDYNVISSRVEKIEKYLDIKA